MRKGWIKMENLYLKLAEFNSFHTPRLILRPFQLADAADMFEYSSDSANLEFIFLPHRSIEETCLSLANNFMKSPLGKWAIELKDEKKMIGVLHFIKISEKNHSAEVGYVLNKAYWRQGLLTEALRTLTELSFEEFGLKSLELLIDVENVASKRVAEKSGYQLIKVFKAKNQYTGIIRKFEKYELNVLSWDRMTEYLVTNKK